MQIRTLLLSGLLALNLQAQNGDKAGESQVPLIPADQIPPAPVLTPAQAIKSFKIAPGFRVELVASEPMVELPIAMQWDGNNRLWVLEMRSFMQQPDGAEEHQPICRLSLLEDANGDGQMDKKTVFVDKLVMPRAFLLVQGGVLVSEPPRLWFYPNQNDKAGARVEVSNDYAKEADPALGTKANPEHAANSLLWAMDNWIYSANFTGRFRLVNGEWKRQATNFRGQYGLSQDDAGRLVYNSNSDQFRMDLVSSTYYGRNPNFRSPSALNLDPIKNQEVWPLRVNPGINRGYQSGMLRNGKLAKFTAACGPVIYRGNQFPAEFLGNAFVCEPSANLIKRNILTDQNGVITGRHAYEKEEFLASTDERFRPVNLYNGPDGALYVLDMYHGIIQHKYFLTSYLRKQSESRGLDKPNYYGRIYRIVHEKAKPSPAPRLLQASGAELVKTLSHANGWWRDSAQQLLVQRAEMDVAPALKNLALKGENPKGRLHALWTLEGLGQLEEGLLVQSLKDSDPVVKSAAIRLSDAFLKTPDKEELLPALVQQTATAGHLQVALQLALTLGETGDPRAEQGMIDLAGRFSSNALVRDALISGMYKRELEMVEKLLAIPEWKTAQPGRDLFLGNLARSLFTERKPARVGKLLELANAAPAWQQVALLDGMASGAPQAVKGKPAVAPKLIHFHQEPAAFVALQKSSSPAVAERVKKINGLITWPGQPGYVAPPPVTPLTEEQKKQMALGKTLFSSSCASCHQPSGLGQEGLAPPLADSEWVLGPEKRLIRIVLQGIRGPVTVQGRTYEMEMPGLAIFDDEQLAAILTYIRREWEHAANPVAPESVRQIRESTAKREEAWTERELLSIQ